MLTLSNRFSHYTWVKSGGMLLVCDIQGVNNVWTDPQICTVDPNIFECQGNVGKNGIEKFLGAHRCNSICRGLKLPACSNGKPPILSGFGTQINSGPQSQTTSIRKSKAAHMFSGFIRTWLSPLAPIEEQDEDQGADVGSEALVSVRQTIATHVPLCITFY